MKDDPLAPPTTFIRGAQIGEVSLSFDETLLRRFIRKATRTRRGQWRAGPLIIHVHTGVKDVDEVHA